MDMTQLNPYGNNIKEDPAELLESDRVEQQLSRLIMTMEIPPGAALTQSYLCELLQCGRTPLREAIQRLATDGLIVAVPQRGISITPLSLTDFIEVQQAELISDPACFSLAAQRITAEELGQLEHILIDADRAIAAGDYGQLAELHFNYHRIVGHASGNRHLAKAMNSIHLHGDRFAILAWKQGAKNAAQTWSEHREMFEALKAKDPKAAEQKSREHALKSNERILAALRG
jgi:DNA-binding GntR family transcriptional regulator